MVDQYGYSTIIGTPAREDDELVGGGSWPRSDLMEMDDKFTSAVREAFAASNESATAAAATVVTTTSEATMNIETFSEARGRANSLGSHAVTLRQGARVGKRNWR